MEKAKPIIGSKIPYKNTDPVIKKMIFQLKDGSF